MSSSDRHLADCQLPGAVAAAANTPDEHERGGPQGDALHVTSVGGAVRTIVLPPHIKEHLLLSMNKNREVRNEQRKAKQRHQQPFTAEQFDTFVALILRFDDKALTSLDNNDTYEKQLVYDNVRAPSVMPLYRFKEMLQCLGMSEAELDKVLALWGRHMEACWKAAPAQAQRRTASSACRRPHSNGDVEYRHTVDSASDFILSLSKHIPTAAVLTGKKRKRRQQGNPSYDDASLLQPDKRRRISAAESAGDGGGGGGGGGDDDEGNDKAGATSTTSTKKQATSLYYLEQRPKLLKSTWAKYILIWFIKEATETNARLVYNALHPSSKLTERSFLETSSRELAVKSESHALIQNPAGKGKMQDCIVCKAFDNRRSRSTKYCAACDGAVCVKCHITQPNGVQLSQHQRYQDDPSIRHKRKKRVPIRRSTSTCTICDHEHDGAGRRWRSLERL